MNLNLSTWTPADSRHINVTLPDEVRYWSWMLGCSEADIRFAVREVGPDVEDVRHRIAQTLSPVFAWAPASAGAIASPPQERRRS